MKSLFKIISFIFILFGIGSVFANNINFNSRISDFSSYMTGSSFSDLPISISSGSSIDLETIIQTSAGSGAYKYSINFPTGFQLSSYASNVAFGTGICIPSGIQAFDSLFSFNVPDANCIFEFWATYKAIDSGNKTISLLGSGATTTLLGNLSVNVLGTNTIISASTLDINNNGFIDSYKLALAQNDILSNLSGININGALPLSVTQSGSLNSWILTFPDNAFNTADTPQILGNFGGQILTDPSVQEIDSAPMNVSVNTLPGTFTGAQTIMMSGSEAGTIHYSTSGLASSSSSIYNNGIYINTGTVLSVFTKDMVGNTKNFSFNYNFSCVQTAPVNGSISSYPSCIVKCNSGYTLSGNICNAIIQRGGSGGGGGGGSVPVVSSGSVVVSTGTIISLTGTVSSSGSNSGTGVDIEHDPIYFNDINDSFAKADIIYLANKNIIKGYPQNIFKPNNPITRAEYLGIIMKALEIKVDEGITKTDFSDIPEDGLWMIKYIEKAREYGINGQEIISKTGTKKIFRPNYPITRAEALAMLFSISKISTENTMITGFKDIIIDGGLWMVKYIEKATELGIVSGQTIKGELVFRPNDSITRAEATKVIVKTLFLNK